MAARYFQVKLNPSSPSSTTAEPDSSVKSFMTFLSPFLVPQSVQQSLPPSDVVGNIRFRLGMKRGRFMNLNTSNNK